MSTYEPGTVAMVSFESGGCCRAIRRGGVWVFLDSEGYGIDALVTDVRPLVVLDLSPHHVMRTLEALRESRGMIALEVADMIEAQTKPPAPEEPTTRGAVVMDSTGLEWVRVHPGGKAWVNGYERWASWDDLLDVGVAEVVRP